MNQLINLMRKLRSKSGCPWDRKQTMHSLRRCLLEEAHEVLEAISLKDKHKIEEELGDLLVVISMLINMGEEKKSFSRRTVISGALKKMISRHPHVFGSKKAKTAEQALAFFTEVKMAEREKAGQKSVLEDMKLHYPSLLLAYKIQRKVARVGFDWPRLEPVLLKLDEELRELKREIRARRKNQGRIREEMGDLLFTAVNLARKLSIDPEIALKDSVRKFKTRFLHVEQKVKRSGKDWKSFSLPELDRFWEEAKKRRA